MQAQKTVFISYRRTNIYIARAVYYYLKTHGFDVFLDFESIDSGDFGQIIFNEIDVRPHFLIILTPTALERCTDPNDWMRKEIEYAIETKRNIIPMMFEGFNFKKESSFLPIKMKVLSQYNGVTIYPEYFEQGLERLIERFLNTSLNLILHPVSKTEVGSLQQKFKVTEADQPFDPILINAEQAYERGFTHQIIGNDELAIREYSQAILLNTYFCIAYYRRGSCFSNVGKLKQAQSDWEQALSLAKDEPRIHLIKHVYAAFVEKDFRKALDEAKKDIELNPDLADAYHNRGNLYYKIQKYKAALFDHHRAITLNPNYVQAYVGRGNAKYELGDYLEALKDYDTAVFLNPSYALAYNNRGVVWETLRESEKAWLDYEKASAIAPYYKEVISNLERILLIINDEDKNNEVSRP